MAQVLFILFTIPVVSILLIGVFQIWDETLSSKRSLPIEGSNRPTAKVRFGDLLATEIIPKPLLDILAIITLPIAKPLAIVALPLIEPLAATEASILKPLSTIAAVICEPLALIAAVPVLPAAGLTLPILKTLAVGLPIGDCETLNQ